MLTERISYSFANGNKFKTEGHPLKNYDLNFMYCQLIVDASVAILT